ncbi:hypothetical protein K435DRAFT_804428 [Dendrothele bispora CBS 962.96]|uniref:PA14 domain-containing protein n=1 Tax=Dendrothele bispora (strain CBS 962.96) TaxID=1314807 RepID=A0A4S8LET9_DENBC|nr:hypothetical protein K435DRAFT_804428 [Dendrothele bispora CBS 962.96]
MHLSGTSILARLTLVWIFYNIALAAENVTIGNNSSLIEYSEGDWRFEGDYSSGATDHWSGITGAWASFTFTGVAIYYSVHLYPGRYPAGGRFFLDGSSEGNVRLFDPKADNYADAGTIVWSKTGLENTQHTLRCENHQRPKSKEILTESDLPPPVTISENGTQTTTTTVVSSPPMTSPITTSESTSTSTSISTSTYTSASTSTSTSSSSPRASTSTTTLSPLYSSHNRESSTKTQKTAIDSSTSSSPSSSEASATSDNAFLSGGHSKPKLAMILGPVLGGITIFLLLGALIYRMKRKRTIVVTPRSEHKNKIPLDENSSLAPSRQESFQETSQLLDSYRFLPEPQMTSSSHNVPANELSVSSLLVNQNVQNNVGGIYPSQDMVLMPGFRPGESVAVFGAERLQKAKDIGCIPIEFGKGDAVEQILELRDGKEVDRGVDVLEALIRVVRPTGGLGIPVLYVPSDPGAPDSAAAKEVSN